MSSLTQTAYLTRKIIRYTFFVAIGITILRTGINSIAALWRDRHPEPPPPPNVAWGKLPKILDVAKAEEKPTRFRLETIDGQLPAFPDQLKVFFVVTKETKLLALDNTNALVKRLGFTNDPEKLSEEIYRYQNKVNNTTLTVNLFTQSLKFEYPYLNDQTLASSHFESSAEPITIAQGYLNKINPSSPDISPEKTKVILYKFSPTAITPVTYLTEANLARVNFFRTDIEDNYPIFSKNIDKSNISFLVSGSDTENKQILEVDYIHYPIDREKYATYPIKSAQQAWEELQKGEYLLSKADAGAKEKEIPIRKVYLGYFDPEKLINFLEPIYIFEGDNNFVGFVEAVSVEWLGN